METNAMSRDLKKLIEQAELAGKEQAKSDPYRPRFHLAPPVGWMNDPNGLCYVNGWYHVFYQYSPFDANGGLKLWGHYRSRDLLHWEALPVMLYPDQPWDVHGVYSGSAMVLDDEIYLYYTGNVKLAGEYDYVKSGREGNTALAVSRDGITICSDELLMKNTDYPEGLSCHVRDPKVWMQDESFYMVQGARTLKDEGLILVFASEDGRHFSCCNQIRSARPLGYMWECPDLFALDDQYFLLCSPQGLKRDGNHYQNKYSSGYFPLYGDFRSDCRLGEYVELDCGFDFYAPQSFTDERRRIQFGWMGMPDAEYTNPTVKNGWQHILTVPCELQRRGERILRTPVEEIKQLRAGQVAAEEAFVFDFEAAVEESGQIEIRDAARLEWNGKECKLSLTKESGAGREERIAECGRLKNIRILADTSSLEIFLNDGEHVLSTRYYPKPDERGIRLTDVREYSVWQMESRGE